MFDRTYIIALPTRRERTARLKEQFPDAVVINAFHGRDLAAPKWFRAGFGAWGCYVSHVHVLMSAIHDDLDSYLVLEDDAIFVPEYEQNLKTLFEHLPSNWGQLYIGGSHSYAPEMLNEFVYACHSVDRTHAFAVSKRAFRPMLSHLLEVERFTTPDKLPRHVDQVLQQAHEKCLWPVYAPTWWFAGQSGGLSTITMEHLSDRWWHCPAYARALPLVLCGEQPTDKILPYVCFGEKANDAGRNWLLQDALQDRAKLLPILIQLTREALVYGKLPGLATTDITQEELFLMGFKSYTESDDLKELSNYPRNNLINNGYYPKRKATS